MKKFLENLISTKEQRVSALKEQVEKSTDVNDSYNGKPTLVIQSDLNQKEPSGQAYYELQQ